MEHEMETLLLFCSMVTVEHQIENQMQTYIKHEVQNAAATRFMQGLAGM